MTAVAEVEKEPAEQTGPSEAQLLDVLYEVLAQGAPPKGSPTVEAVERFLHEHARNRRPRADILAFFTQHGLPTDPSAYGTDPALTELAAGFIRERGPASASFSLDSGDALRIPAPNESGPIRRMEPAPLELHGEQTAPRAPAPPAAPPTRSGRIVAIAAFACAALLGVAAFASYQHARELEQKLNEARLQQRTTDTALTFLEQRAERLKGALEQSEQARTGLAARFDDFIARDAQERAAESTALERILGKRFETLRTKALAESLAAEAP